MSKLALLGGKPEFTGSFKPFNRIGDEERAAVESVLKSGVLSGFIGAPGPDFDGGPQVKELEKAWRETFRVDHAVSVNSATSGLYAAVGAVGVGPGDEVIVAPYSMSASALAPLVYGGIPVFADIEPDTFCLDPGKVREAITGRTKAIIVVNLFGHPARLHDLRGIADEHGISLIEDNAQAPLAMENGRYAGTIGHIGVFSLNRHKHIQTGEGGICTTDDEHLALRLRIIRNHGENLVEEFGIEDLSNLVGFNYRLTEISAAIGLCQLEKSEVIINQREAYAARLTAGVSGLPGLTPPLVREGCRHVYYAWPARFDAEVAGVSRSVFAKALRAEGVPIDEGYVNPLYELPLFQKRISLGGKGFPFDLSNRTYEGQLCEVCERMHYHEELGFGICSFELSVAEIDSIANAFHKVYDHRADLQGAAATA